MEKYDYYATPEEKQYWLDNHNDLYNEYPVSFVEFVTSKEYLGLEDVYENLLEIGQEFFTSGNVEIVLLLWIGSGKSYLAQLGILYMTYKLLCLKNPHWFFKLSADKPIEIINMWLNATQARDVVFAGMLGILSQSSYFERKMKLLWGKIEAKKTEVDFWVWKESEGKVWEFNILKLLSGNSKETAPIGRNIFMWVLDEAAFYMSNEDKDTAEDIYNSIKARISSRYGKYWMVILISSPKYEDDFISKKYKEGLQFPELVSAHKGKTWTVKNRDLLSEEVFIFDHNNYKVVKKSNYDELWIELNESTNYHLRFGNDLDNLYWIIPEDYLEPFTRSPEKSTRDLGAKVIWSLEWFIKQRAFIDLALWKVENRVDKFWTWNVENPIAQSVYIHVDLALNRWWRGDHAGIAVCHVDWYTNEWRPYIKFDFVERIWAWTSGEIDFKEVRARIINLKNNWWNIWRVTLDWYQSIDFLQILNSLWIKSEYLSVDTSLEPYEAVKEALYDERMHLPDNVEILAKELKELELVKGKKVDHPLHGSKDVADSIAGATFSAIQSEWYANTWRTYLIQ